MRKKGLMALGLAMGMSLSMSLLSYANPTQSARWVGSGDRWQVSDNNGGFIKDCWFEDDVTHHWYMLGAEDGSVMYSGLVTDKSTGKSYLLNVNHDGTFGRMLTVDGVYNINGVDVYMTFNQAHDGSFGAITSGLSEVRNAGVNERQLDKIPTDNGGQEQSNTENTTPPDNNGAASGLVYVGPKDAPHLTGGEPANLGEEVVTELVQPDQKTIEAMKRLTQMLELN